MTREIIGWCVIGGLLSLVAYSLWRLLGEAEQVHGTLKQFRQLAEQHRDREHLEMLRLDLITYANKKCWHRHFVAHAKEVLAYIDGKLTNIP